MVSSPSLTLLFIQKIDACCSYSTCRETALDFAAPPASPPARSCSYKGSGFERWTGLKNCILIGVGGGTLGLRG